MCDKAVDDCLEALKCISDWFVTSKMPEKFDNALHANDDIVFYNEDFNKITIITNQRHMHPPDLDKINFNNDNDFYRDDSDSIIFVRLLVWCSNF